MKKSRLLMKEQPLVIDKELAKLIGLNEAIVLQQIQEFLEESENDGINFINDKYWVRSSVREWLENEFCFFSESTLKRTLSKLEKLNIIETEMFNETKMDQTKWYTIKYDNLNEFCNENIKEKNKFYGYVYFVKENLGNIKIGYTKNIKKRLEQIKRARHSELALLYCIKTSNIVCLEAFFHDKFKNNRVEGEWFNLNNKDVNWIKSGKFPKEILEIIVKEEI